MEVMYGSPYRYFHLCTFCINLEKQLNAIKYGTYVDNLHDTITTMQLSYHCCNSFTVKVVLKVYLKYF